MQLKSSWIDHKILYRCVFYLIIWFNETNHTVSQLMFMCASRMPGTDQDMAGLWDKVLVLVELTLGAFYLQAWGWSLWSWDEYSRLISAPWKLWASEGDRWVVQEQEQHKVKKEALHLQRRRGTSEGGRGGHGELPQNKCRVQITLLFYCSPKYWYLDIDHAASKSKWCHSAQESQAWLVI